MFENRATAHWIVVGIVDADESSKQSVIDLLSPNCRITFIDCTYSYKQREALFNEIRVMDDTDILDVVLLRNDERIAVIVSKGSVDYYTEKLNKQFGDIVWVTDVIVSHPILPNVIAPARQWWRNIYSWILPIAILFLCGVAILLYFTRTRSKTTIVSV